AVGVRPHDQGHGACGGGDPGRAARGALPALTRALAARSAAVAQRRLPLRRECQVAPTKPAVVRKPIARAAMSTWRIRPKAVEESSEIALNRRTTGPPSPEEAGCAASGSGEFGSSEPTPAISVSSVVCEDCEDSVVSSVGVFVSDGSSGAGSLVFSVVGA